jgi:hypothetical protein
MTLCPNLPYLKEDLFTKNQIDIIENADAFFLKVMSKLLFHKTMYSDDKESHCRILINITFSHFFYKTEFSICQNKRWIIL